LTFWGLLYRPPFTDEGQIWCAVEDPLCTLMCQISSRRLFCRPLVKNNLNFCHIFDFGIQWCRQLAAIWESWARAHNYKPSPIQRYQNLSVLQRIHGEIWRTKSDVQKRDGQRDKQTKCKPYQTWHGDRGPRARSCVSKTFGVWRMVSPLGGTEYLGMTRPCQLKTPITP